MKTYSKARATLSFLAGVTAGLLLVACSHAGISAKVYYLDAAQGGLVRKQANEVVPFEKAVGYRCMNPQDFDAVLNMLKSCLSGNSASVSGVGQP